MSSLDESYAITWLDDGQICSIRPKVSWSATFNAWARELVEILQSWPDERPFLTVFDLTSPGVGLYFAMQNRYDVFNVGVNEYGRQEIKTLCANRPQLHIRLAVVVSGNLSGQVIAKRAPSNQADFPNMEANLFIDYDAGVRWLRQQLPGPDASER